MYMQRKAHRQNQAQNPSGEVGKQQREEEEQDLCLCGQARWVEKDTHHSKLDGHQDAVQKVTSTSNEETSTARCLDRPRYSAVRSKAFSTQLESNQDRDGHYSTM
jgi:hypothetical protein